MAKKLHTSGLFITASMCQVEFTELPSPEELMPLTQTLITPDLASAFCIALDPPTSGITVRLASERTLGALCFQGNSSSLLVVDAHLNSFAHENQPSVHSSFSFLPDRKADNGQQSILSFQDVGNAKAMKLEGGAWQRSDQLQTVLPPAHDVAINIANEAIFPPTERRADNGCGSGFGGTDSSEYGPGRKLKKRLDMDFEDVESSLGLENLSEEPAARTRKRPRLVWTPPLHKLFVDAVAYLGIKNAVPKTIMQLMNKEGLTRENVASHLQKYRLYLKRMQGHSSEGLSLSGQLFASTPVPPSLATSAQFLSNYGEDMLPLLMPVASGGAGQTHIIPGPLGWGEPYANFDHHIYSALARSSTVQGLQRADLDYLVESQQRPSSPQSHVLTFFPAGGS